MTEDGKRGWVERQRETVWCSKDVVIFKSAGNYGLRLSIWNWQKSIMNLFKWMGFPPWGAETNSSSSWESSHAGLRGFSQPAESTWGRSRIWCRRIMSLCRCGIWLRWIGLFQNDVSASRLLGKRQKTNANGAHDGYSIFEQPRKYFLFRKL